LRDRLGPLTQASEIRSIAADDFWLSPFNGRGCIAFHFTWQPDWPAVEALLPEIEALLDPFDARPHWGKLFSTPPARLRELYPRIPDFQALAREFDPTGKFRNPFLDRYIFGAQ
jgi:xylitol oxidase